MPLIPDSSAKEAPPPEMDVREPPARRLGILYVSSLTAIAILSGISLEFALRELSWQSRTLRSVSQSTSETSIERSLCLPALALLADQEAAERQANLEALRREINRWGPDARLASLRRFEAAPQSDLATEITQAETDLRGAIDAAGAVVRAFGPGQAQSSATAPAAAALRLLVGKLVLASEAFRNSHSQVMTRVENEAAGHVDRLRSLGFRIFGFVMAVLLLEGLFVISPAVRKIQQVIAEMDRSHRDLKTYAAKLERSNRELQDFASVASHDLQEPLRKVQAFSDRLRSKYGAVLDVQGGDYLDRVQNAAGRMQTLIDDLLTYSRVTTKAQPFVPVDLAAATRDVLADLEVRIERTGGRVEVAELPTVEADPLQVRQLMQNLIGNALKYHRPEAPPIVKVHSAQRERDRLGANGDTGQEFCQVMVEDNGIGFDEAYSERIFGIFQRLHGRTEYEGTGVGLAVCRKIAERHGGTVTARSTPGQGSTFTITLPLRQSKEVTHAGCGQ
jgi:signal transduction histidine kinase